MKRRRRRWVLLALGGLCVALAMFLTFRAPRGERDGVGAGSGAAQSGSSTRPGGHYYLGGAVDRPGLYALPGSPTMLRQALSAAGGPRDAGAGAFVTIARRGDREPELIKVDLAPLLRDGAGDEPLRDGDQVLVTDWR